MITCFEKKSNSFCAWFFIWYWWCIMFQFYFLLRWWGYWGVNLELGIVIAIHWAFTVRRIGAKSIMFLFWFTMLQWSEDILAPALLSFVQSAAWVYNKVRSPREYFLQSSNIRESVVWYWFLDDSSSSRKKYYALCNKTYQLHIVAALETGWWRTPTMIHLTHLPFFIAHLVYKTLLWRVAAVLVLLLLKQLNHVSTRLVIVLLLLCSAMRQEIIK
jgi:hypothetical protein